VRDGLSVYLRLVGAQLRAQMQYRVSFAMAVAGGMAVNAIEFGVVLVVFSRVPTLVGWSLAEVALLYGLSGSAFALAEMAAAAMDDFDRHIVRGSFDRILVRPRATLLQVMSEDIALRRLGRLAQAAAVLAFAVQRLEISWAADKVAVLVLALACGTVIYFCIFVLGAAFCFWTVQAKEATHVLTYGGDGLSAYPFDIYHGAVRRFFTFVVPLAFVSYQPALYLLDRPDQLGLPAGARLMGPVAACVMVLAARYGWKLGVRHYQSTGS
jgi:ABC-2 type transport system permease protein